MDYFFSQPFYVPPIGGSFYLLLYRSRGRVIYHTYPSNPHERTLLTTGNRHVRSTKRRQPYGHLLFAFQSPLVGAEVSLSRSSADPVI